MFAPQQFAPPAVFPQRACPSGGSGFAPSAAPTMRGGTCAYGSVRPFPTANLSTDGGGALLPNPSAAAHTTAAELFAFAAQQEAHCQEEMAALGDALVMEEAVRAALAEEGNANHATIVALEAALAEAIAAAGLDGGAFGVGPSADALFGVVSRAAAGEALLTEARNDGVGTAAWQAYQQQQPQPFGYSQPNASHGGQPLSSSAHHQWPQQQQLQQQQQQQQKHFGAPANSGTAMGPFAGAYPPQQQQQRAQPPPAFNSGYGHNSTYPSSGAPAVPNPDDRPLPRHAAAQGGFGQPPHGLR